MAFAKRGQELFHFGKKSMGHHDVKVEWDPLDGSLLLYVGKNGKRALREPLKEPVGSVLL
jgi:hypothetical protein